MGKLQLVDYAMFRHAEAGLRARLAERHEGTLLEVAREAPR